MKLIAAALFLIILVAPVESFAKTPKIEYQTTGYKFEKIPTFCIMEPQETQTLPKNIMPFLVKAAKASIDAWVGPLKSTAPRDAKWDINTIVLPSFTPPNEKCDLTISFYQNLPPELESSLELLGVHYIKN